MPTTSREGGSTTNASYHLGMEKSAVKSTYTNLNTVFQAPRLALSTLVSGLCAQGLGASALWGVLSLGGCILGLYVFRFTNQKAGTAIFIATAMALLVALPWNLAVAILVLSAVAALGAWAGEKTPVEVVPAETPKATVEPTNEPVALLPRWFTEFSDAHGQPEYMRTSRNYIELCNSEHSSYVRLSMSSASEQIPKALGLRVHKEYYVLRASVAGSTKKNSRPFLVLTNGKEIPVGRSFAAQVKAEGLLD